MENASEAFMMAFAMLIFGIAVTITMTMFSQARQTSDYILYQKDESNYYEFEDGAAGTERVVGIETIVPTLYKYYKENFKVIFMRENGTYLEVAPTVANPPPGWVNPYPINNRMICSFDIKEETDRREVWTSSEEIRARNLYYFLFGGSYTINRKTINYGTGFLAQYGDREFIERIGYEMQGGAGNNGFSTNKLTGTEKKVIYFILRN